jgi:hypothetical protein
MTKSNEVADRSKAIPETRHFYYNANRQLFEERRESDSVIAPYADRQNVWGLRYTDNLILRDRPGGTFNYVTYNAGAIWI